MRSLVRIMALLVAAPLLSSAPALAASADDAVAALKKGVPYSQARQDLMKGGWMAAPIDLKLDKETRCGTRIEICVAYPETESCSGTGMGFCLFRFEDAGRRVLTVTTVGEELPDLTVHEWEKP